MYLSIYDCLWAAAIATQGQSDIEGWILLKVAGYDNDNYFYSRVVSGNVERSFFFQGKKNLKNGQNVFVFIAEFSFLKKSDDQ